MAESGDLIGPYRLVSQLGKGAMGEVWRARDERLDRYVALKVLPAEQALDIERRARMLREARAAAAIRHGSVVTLFDIVSHKGDDILVMELVEGRTLSDTLRKEGAPQLETALRWIEGIADALAAAHARGILHRDIKAANIMVTGDGIKVLDFGLAKLRDGEPAFTSVNRKPMSVDGVVELDATMPSRPLSSGNAIPVSLDATHSTGHGGKDAVDSYRTHVGQLLGTPLYMAPEQVDGALPDEISEVFSVGVLAHEILGGKPPYTATSMDELFRQIANDPPPPLEHVPPSVEDLVVKALAKDRGARFTSMAALRDAVAAERKRRFAPRTRRWPLIIAILVAAAALAGAAILWRATRPPTERPGDEYVKRALGEYDVFYNDKAFASLRAALAAAPQHPRANAYMILFGGAPESDRGKALAAAQQGRNDSDARSKDRALLDAAIALVEKGPRLARRALEDAGATSDRELAFWAAELDYRAANYQTAYDEYTALLAEPAHELRGRIYDHYSSVLLYLDRPEAALKIGQLYRDAFPGEPDAVGVYATTLSAAGVNDKAIEYAEEAVRLNEGEDTLAGLGKVVAISGNRTRAKELYQRSLEKAGPARRPIRRAALAMLQWIDGDTSLAKATVAPCLDGADAHLRERGACLFVAGTIEPERADDIAHRLEALAGEATDARPAYGAPKSLATLLRARAAFFSGACVVDPGRADVAPIRPGTPPRDAFDVPLDFYAAYHVPFFATWAICEKAALAATADRSRAAALLRPVATRAPNRTWLVERLRTYER